MDNHPRKTWAAGRSSNKRMVRPGHLELGDLTYIETYDSVRAVRPIIVVKPRYAGGHHSDARYSSKRMIAKPGRQHHTTE